MLEIDLSLTRGAFVLRAQAQLAERATGIFGPSGAGKSTLLALIAGHLRPDLGTVRFRGYTWVDSRQGLWVPPWQRGVGLVHQDGLLFSHLKVRDNLLFGARYAQLPSALSLDAVADLLELKPHLSQTVRTLSGGERQRVALGRALLAAPQLLLLDEPLAALDPRRKRQILPFLQRVRDEYRIPLLYVSHAAEELQQIATQIWRLEDGAMRAIAPPTAG